MSQVTFKADSSAGKVVVMGGWDHPMKEFFLTIFEDNADEKVVWSQMHKPLPEDKTGTTRLEAKLAEYRITPPPGFWDLVHRQEGNVIHVYDGKTASWKQG